MALEATFDIRRTTTGARHSTVGGRRLRTWRHPTFSIRLSVVGCHSAVDRRMSNVVYYSFSDATNGTSTTQENAVTTQERVGATQENAVKNAVTTQETSATTQEVTPKDTGIAPKDMEIAPKGPGVAPKNNGVAPKVALKTREVAPKTSEVAPKGDEVAPKNAVKEFDAELRENVVEKCAELYCFLKVDPRRTILTAVESLGFSPRSVAQYLNVLKDAHVLEHVGPTNGGSWKFLI